MHRKLTTAVILGLAASVILGATAANAQTVKPGKILVDKNLHIKNPQALVGPNWDGQPRIPQPKGKQIQAQR